MNLGIIKTWLYHIPHTTFEENPEERTCWEDIWITPADDELRDMVFDEEEDEVNSFWLTVEGYGMQVKRNDFVSEMEYKDAVKEHLQSLQGRVQLDMEVGVLRIPFEDFNHAELIGWARVFLKDFGFTDIELIEVEHEDFPGINEQTIMLEEISNRLKSLEEDEDFRGSALEIGHTDSGKKIMILPEVLEDTDLDEEMLLKLLSNIDDNEEEE